ncbi:MAG: hypothetical protein EZS28_017550 [Streblomastix strix]|uniref:Uncharacterized protein n=1 Tax=Streblomastix strix TaxID=222440 RepID=A0A5J4VX65_9EUKA|nr:MAG: hypothetical protein EZS28_017550 [Streblomastix strix]
MKDGAGEQDQNLDLGNEDEEEEEIEDDDDLQAQKKQQKNIDDEDNIEMVLRRLKQQVAQKLKEQNNQEYELNDEQKNNDNDKDNEDDWGGFVDDLIEEENRSKEKDSGNNNNNNSTINYNADMSENTPDDQRQKHQLNAQQLEILSLATAASDGEVAEIAVVDVVTAEDASYTIDVSGTVEAAVDYAAADAAEAVLATNQQKIRKPEKGTKYLNSNLKLRKRTLRKQLHIQKASTSARPPKNIQGESTYSTHR